MALSGAQKAAALLMTLDPPTAAELLRSAGPDMLTEVAAELTYLGQSGQANQAASMEPIREFFGLLYGKNKSAGGENLAGEILKIILGEQKSQEVLVQVGERLKVRDPFRDIRSAEVTGIAKTLAGESPQVIAVVLSELPAKKSSELLELLEEDIRAKSVQSMAGGQGVSQKAKLRIASTVQSRLSEAAQAAAQAEPGAADTDADDEHRQQQLRKVAVLLRGLEVEARDNLTKSLKEKDSESAESVQKLMVIWEDIPLVAERPLQEALRSTESRKLALALVGANEQIASRIKNNISERAKAMLDEEAELLSNPKANEIEQAREDILDAMRELNAKGELQFEENQE